MINSLNVAQTGLLASKASVENVMNNIANANTEGYKKRVVETSELSIADTRIWGRGVSLDDTVRITSQYMYDNIIKENSTETYYSQMSTLLSNVESAFSETDESGFSADLDRYYQTIESLRANPENEVYKSELSLNGQQIVDDLQSLYADIEDQEELAMDALNQYVKEINNILSDIAEVNDKINDQGYASNDLLDKRDLLEKELSSYANVSIDRDNEFYELKLGGEVVVRNNNARILTIGEEATPQRDRYVNNDQTSSILNGVTFDQQDKIVFDLNNTTSISVEYGESLTFDLDGDGVDDNVTVDETNYVRALVYKINSNSQLASQVKAYNGNYYLDENGTKVTDDSSDAFLLLESKVDGVEGNFESKITFVESSYTTISTSDNGVTSSNLISSIASSGISDGTSISFDVTLNAAQATDTQMAATFTDDTGAYFTLSPTFTNGVTYDSTTGQINIPAGVTTFSITMDTNELADTDVNQNYTFALTDDSIVPTATLGATVTVLDVSTAISNNIFKTEEQSNDATNTVSLQTFDEAITVSDGKLKAILENLTTESGKNKFDTYKTALDDFAKTFVDMTASYFKNDDDTYIYGEMATDESGVEATTISLFSGANVKSLSFNENAIGDLTQADYDYLATMQWKDDISFQGFGQDSSITDSDNELRSFSEFFQDLRIKISRDKENSDFLLDTQKAITESLTNSYEQMVNVDTDEEMVDLIKFQAAYTANAKIITVVDEMLDTILGIR